MPDAEKTWPLEPDDATLRTWCAEAVDLVCRHVATLADQPAQDVAGAVEEALGLGEDCPEGPGDAVALLREVVADHVPRSLNTAGPGYLAYIPGGGLPTAAIAEFVAAMTNRFTGMAAPAPRLVALEVNALRWLAEALGMPEGTRGVFTSGGSMANLGAIVCARHAVLGEDFTDGVIYTGDQAHQSVTKSARIAGFAGARVRMLPSDSAGRLAPETLRAAVAEDAAAGLRPALVVASAGTVGTGAVDDLAGLRSVADDHGLWLHVDGAYGGFFGLTDRGRTALAGMESADSLTLDPHKGLFLPYGTGCLLVADGRVLRDAHHEHGAYLPTAATDPRLQDFTLDTPELSRPYRGLPVWFSLKTFGLAAFREALDEKLDLARHCWERLERIPGLATTGEPDLSITAFRSTAGDPATDALLERINGHQRIMVTATTFQGQRVIRLCVLSFRTHRDRIDEGLAVIEREAAAVRPA